jgi:hypothetical protein
MGTIAAQVALILKIVKRHKLFYFSNGNGMTTSAARLAVMPYEGVAATPS